MIIPLRQGQSPVRPPGEQYLMMAAAQMHKEGRLIAQNQPDEWDQGNWGNTWRQMVPEGHGTLPEGWETIHRHGLIYGRPPQKATPPDPAQGKDLVS